MKYDVTKLIKKYLEYYPEEVESTSMLVKLVNDNKDNNENLINRKNFQGHLTASGFIYCIENGKLLLLEHKSLKCFLQPGGHVEAIDNEMIDAAKREIEEETGLKDLDIISIDDEINVPFDIDSHFIPKNEKKNEDEHYHHDFRYFFTINSLKDIKIDFNESNGYRWVDLDILESHPRFAKVLGKIRKMIKKAKSKKLKQ